MQTAFGRNATVVIVHSFLVGILCIVIGLPLIGAANAPQISHDDSPTDGIGNLQYVDGYSSEGFGTIFNIQSETVLPIQNGRDIVWGTPYRRISLIIWDNFREYEYLTQANLPLKPGTTATTTYAVSDNLVSYTFTVVLDYNANFQSTKLNWTQIGGATATLYIPRGSEGVLSLGTFQVAIYSQPSVALTSTAQIVGWTPFSPGGSSAYPIQLESKQATSINEGNWVFKDTYTNKTYTVHYAPANHQWGVNYTLS